MLMHFKVIKAVIRDCGLGELIHPVYYSPSELLTDHYCPATSTNVREYCTLDYSVLFIISHS